MLLPTTPVLDTFNRADSNPLSGNWAGPLNIGDNQIMLASNQVLASVPAAVSSSWYLATYGPECECYCTIATLASAAEATVVYARVTNPNTATMCGYRVRMTQVDGGADTVDIQRTDNATSTTLGASITTDDFIAGDGLMIRCIGDQISAYHRTSGVWTLLGTRTDATYATAGVIALKLQNDHSRIDDFGGGTVNPHILYWTKRKARRGRRFTTLTK